ncbi:uncharacterized protein LOC131175437 [Hevea brasiliensis]|uniref:uncharacterized protein LOC131175437 n=1 Tax=Hevea brasiliensis TaxID=3981 RepID=UPI0025E87549|nr:uncharacterized protein LOC131175437 [Hevea brasiliensis]
MYWFFKSLQSDDPDSSSSSPSSSHPHDSPTIRGGGVKQDFSVIGESVGRQLRGVANFLAPPPSPPSSSSLDKSLPSDDSSSLSSQSQALLGIRNDLAEIGGSLRSGLSLLSSNKAVSEISKFTSSFLQFQSDNNEEKDEDDYVPGITEDVIGFVQEISMRPECWTDFPLSLENDFKMSDAQREHASTVEQMVPGLTALRVNIHSYMEDEQFWMIYFILLLPRLNEHDFEILSTPQIVETRSVLLRQLQNKRNVKVESSENSSMREEENISSREKEVTDIANATGRLEIDNYENADQWLKETQIDTGTILDRQKRLEHEIEEDVSFSDLEDDDNGLSSRLSGSRQAQDIIRAPSPTDWVQLNESSGAGGGPQKARQSISREKDSDGESNDWLKVDDFD